MTLHTRLAAVLLVCLAAGATAGAAPKAESKTQGKGLAGIWQGTLSVGAIDLRLVFHIQRKPDGTQTGTMDSIDQEAKGIAIDTIDLQGGKVRMELKKIKAVFQGKLNGDGTQIAGEWKQLGPKLPLTLRRVAKAPVVARPQEPKRPYPYAEHEVTYENKKAGIKFAGTLTVPRGPGPFPAVLLLSGSGPQDRDEALMGHRPFLVLADHLTRHGIAVLRVDDRGVGGSTGKKLDGTLTDLADDALAGVAFLKTRQEIDPHKIGLVGHSEGGLVAPLAASRSRDVAFIVMLAGTGLPGEEVMYLQGQAVVKAMGLDEKVQKAQREVQELVFGVLKQEKDDVQAMKLLLERFDAKKAKLSPAEQKEYESARGSLQAQLKVWVAPWFRFFLSYDPRPTLRKVQVPVLAMIGTKDVQVLAKENLEAIGQALKEGGNKDYALKEMPGLNHLFQNAKTGAVAEYSRIEETFAPAALEVLTSWIQAHTKS